MFFLNLMTYFCCLNTKLNMINTGEYMDGIVRKSMNPGSRNGVLRLDKYIGNWRLGEETDG